MLVTVYFEMLLPNEKIFISCLIIGLIPSYLG